MHKVTFGALLPKLCASLIVPTVDTIALQYNSVYGDILTPATIERKVQSGPIFPTLSPK
jgi:hypothetical protein